MTSPRMRRVNEGVREVIGEAIHELSDPRIGFVTVTGVDTSPDLRHAKVYVSVLGDEAARTSALEGLRSAHGALQRRINDELDLKWTPRLRFVYDETIETGVRISKLLDDEA